MKTPRRLKLSKRELTITSITLSALAYSYTQAFVLKKRVELNKMNLTISSLESTISGLTSVIGAIQEKRQIASTPIVPEGHLPQFFTTSTSLSNLISELTKDDPENQFNVKKIKGNIPTAISKPDQTKSYDEYGYEVHLETSFVSIGKFIERLEKSNIALDVLSVEIKRVNSDLKRCYANIQLIGYVPIGKES